MAPPPAPPGRKLNLGCGKDIRPAAEGWVNMDFVKLPGVDPVHDMLDLPWPFPAGHFDHLFASHVVEHIPPRLPGSNRDAFFLLMEEAWRVLKPGGTMLIETPYYGDDLKWRDPTHYRVFHRRSMEYFDPADANHYYTSATFEQLGYRRLFAPRGALSGVYVGGKGVFFWLCDLPLVQRIVGRGMFQRFELRKTA